MTDVSGNPVDVLACALQSWFMGKLEASMQLSMYQESTQQCSQRCVFEHDDPVSLTLWGGIKALLRSHALIC